MTYFSIALFIAVFASSLQLLFIAAPKVKIFLFAEYQR